MFQLLSFQCGPVPDILIVIILENQIPGSHQIPETHKAWETEQTIQEKQDIEWFIVYRRLASIKMVLLRYKGRNNNSECDSQGQDYVHPKSAGSGVYRRVCLTYLINFHYPQHPGLRIDK